MAQLAAAAAAAKAHPALVVADEGPAVSARAARPERPLLSLFAVGVLRCDGVSSRGAQQFDAPFRRQMAVVAAEVQPQEAARVAGAVAVEAARRRSGPCRPSGRWRSSRASSWPSLVCAASMTSSARRHCSLAASGGALMGTGQPRRARQPCEGSADALQQRGNENAGLIFPSPEQGSESCEGTVEFYPLTPAPKPVNAGAARARRGRALHLAARAYASRVGCL